MESFFGIRSAALFSGWCRNLQGIATALFHHLLEDVLSENPSLQALTVNFSPYGLPFYLRIGFIPLSEEQKISGIQFTPMKYVVKS